MFPLISFRFTGTKIGGLRCCIDVSKYIIKFFLDPVIDRNLDVDGFYPDRLGFNLDTSGKAERDEATQSNSKFRIFQKVDRFHCCKVNCLVRTGQCKVSFSPKIRIYANGCHHVHQGSQILEGYQVVEDKTTYREFNQVAGGLAIDGYPE